MEISKIEAAIEAVLFTFGSSVEVEKIALAIDLGVEDTRKIIHNMMDKYDSEDRGIKIIELENSFQMCTKAEFYDNLIKVASQPRRYVLTDAVLESLSIVAYKQPVTRLEIEKIRGVSSDHAISKLVEYGLIEEVGRLDAPGRPMLFGTTEEFLRAFGVQSIEELPVISSDLVADFKEQAELEIGLEKVNVDV